MNDACCPKQKTLIISGNVHLVVFIFPIDQMSPQISAPFKFPFILDFPEKSVQGRTKSVKFQIEFCKTKSRTKF